MHGGSMSAGRAAPVPDAHLQRVWRWPAKHLRGEPKLAWSILYARNGYRLGKYHEHVTPAYIGGLYNAADPRDAGQTVLAHWQRVHLVRCITREKTLELELLDTEEAFRIWQQELGIVIADPQAEFPFTELGPPEPDAMVEEDGPAVAITLPREGDRAGAVDHNRSRTQGSSGLAGQAFGGLRPGDTPARGDIPGKSPAFSPPRARSFSLNEESKSLIPHPAQRSSSSGESAQVRHERARGPANERDIPGKSPAGNLASIGDVAGGALARLLDDECWEAQMLRRREATAKLIAGWVADPGMFDTELAMYARLVVEGRIELSLVEGVVKAIDGFPSPPTSRGKVFNALMQRHCCRLGINVKLARKGYS